jgi:hypothetical protein
MGFRAHAMAATLLRVVLALGPLASIFEHRIEVSTDRCAKEASNHSVYSQRRSKTSTLKRILATNTMISWRSTFVETLQEVSLTKLYILNGHTGEGQALTCNINTLLACESLSSPFRIPF